MTTSDSADRIPFNSGQDTVPDKTAQLAAELKKQVNDGDILQHLDRGRLNDLTKRSLEKGAYFGRNIELGTKDREQFGMIAGYMRELIQPQMETEEWKAFRKLEEEGVARGVLIGMATHEGSRVPKWVVNGGPGAEVKKTLRGENSDQPSIQVPEQVYKTFDMIRYIEGLELYVQSSDETIKGRSAKNLGDILSRLGQFIHRYQEGQKREA